MSEFVYTAEALQELGVTGLLALAAIVEGLVIVRLFTALMNCYSAKNKS